MKVFTQVLKTCGEIQKSIKTTGHYNMESFFFVRISNYGKITYSLKQYTVPNLGYLKPKSKDSKSVF